MVRNINLNIPIIEKLVGIAEKVLIDTWREPWMIKRIGYAQTDVKANEMEVLARKQQEITKTLSLSPSDNVSQQITVAVEKEFHRQQYNLSKAIAHAIQEINKEKTNKENYVSDDIDNDWLNRWKGCASNFSVDDMQKLWGRILAGEVEKPGTFGYQTLEVVNRLTSKDAELFMRFANCSVGFAETNIVIYPYGWDRHTKFPLKEIMVLNELGLLHDSVKSYSGSLEANVRTWITNQQEYGFYFLSQQVADLKFHGLSFTQAGSDLARLSDLSPDVDYFSDTVIQLKQYMPFEVGYGVYH